MNLYYLFNLILALITLPACYVLNERRWANFAVTTRIAVLMIVFVYPWDFFAISLRSWGYPHDPGFRLYGVPLNDLVFTWICTQLGASVLFRIDRGHARG